MASVPGVNLPGVQRRVEIVYNQLFGDLPEKLRREYIEQDAETIADMVKNDVHESSAFRVTLNNRFNSIIEGGLAA